MSEFTESIKISASPEEVWTVLSDIGRICEWNPGVKRSEQISEGEVGVGATRRCDLNGKNYLNEQVIVFEPTRRLTIRITDTNLPFQSADLRFSLIPGDDVTTVTVSPDYELKFALLGRVIDRLMVRAKYRNGMRELLKGLKAHVETRCTS